MGEGGSLDLHPSIGEELAIREEEPYAEVDLGMVIDGVAREFDIVEREEGVRGDKNERAGVRLACVGGRCRRGVEWRRMRALTSEGGGWWSL